MATKFGDIAKGPLDLLGDDYTNKVTLKSKKPAGPIAVTIETERNASGGLVSKVGGKFAYAGLSFDKVQHTPVGSLVLESSISPYPGLKLSFKGHKGADLGIDYKNGGFASTTKFDVKEFSKLSTSGCLSMSSGLTAGGAITYSIKDKKVNAADVGASYSTGPLFAAVTTRDMVSTYHLSCLYKVNDDISIATSSSHSYSKKIDDVVIGGSFKAGNYGNIKAKAGMDRVVSACVTKEVSPGVSVTASGSIKGMDKSTFTYGLGITM